MHQLCFKIFFLKLSKISQLLNKTILAWIIGFTWGKTKAFILLVYKQALLVSVCVTRRFEVLSEAARRDVCTGLFCASLFADLSSVRLLKPSNFPASEETLVP